MESEKNINPIKPTKDSSKPFEVINESNIQVIEEDFIDGLDDNKE